MKTLYESILDDEDVLFGEVKKTLNPFVMIFNLLTSSEDIKNDIKTQTEIKKIFNKYLTEALPHEAINNIKFKFSEDMLRVLSYKLTRYDEELFIITRNNLEAVKTLNAKKGDKISILFIDDKAFRKEVKAYGFVNPKHYRDWRDFIVAKYKLNKTNDNCIYTI